MLGMSLLGQGIAGQDLTSLFMQAPAYALLIWYLWQDGKRRMQENQYVLEAEKSRDERFLNHINNIETRHETVVRDIAESHRQYQVESTQRLISAIEKNSEVLDESIAASARSDAILSSVAEKVGVEK